MSGHNAAGLTSEGTFTPDKLYDRDTKQRKLVFASGGGVVKRGTVIGKITEGAKTAAAVAGVPAPAAATITASPTAAVNTKVGKHRFECIVGGSGSASKWRHTDPDGDFVGVATGATAYAGGGLSGLTIADPGTDPTPGEAFEVTVTSAEASGKYVKSVAAAIDGSQVPDAIAGEDVDTSEGDGQGIGFIAGTFNQNALILGAGHTLASIDAVLRSKSIYLDNAAG